MIQYKIFHETIFHYNTPVSFSHNIARLKPAQTSYQKLEEYTLDVQPNTNAIHEYKDYLGNTLSKIFIKKTHEKLSVTAHSIVTVDEVKIAEKIKSLNNIDISSEELSKDLQLINDETLYVKQFLFPSDLIPYATKEILDYAMESFSKQDNLYIAIHDLTKRIFTDFEFKSGFSDITTPIETIFKERKGVCQDFASLAISILRAYNIPTRYASGYIQTYPEKGQKKLFGADASHAWFSVYLGRYGWIDFDPTNNKMPNEEYILLGYGRDYHDITPLKGVVQSSGSSYLSVRVDVSKMQ
jgi:transglutaminase-like putative cysteine protease